MNEKSRPSLELSPLSVRIPRAAQMLGIGRSKFYELIRSGDVKTVKAGRATLVVVQSLHDFIIRNQQS